MVALWTYRQLLYCQAPLDTPPDSFNSPPINVRYLVTLSPLSREGVVLRNFPPPPRHRFGRMIIDLPSCSMMRLRCPPVVLPVGIAFMISLIPLTSFLYSGLKVSSLLEL